MAVFTHLTATDLDVVGEAYGLQVRRATPIAHGSANTTLRLDTDRGRFVLTLVEDASHAQTVELARLLDVLGEAGFPTSLPHPTTAGDRVPTVRGRPVLLKPYLDGDIARDPTPSVLGQVGEALSRLHEIPSPAFLSHRTLPELWKATPKGLAGLDVDAGWAVRQRLRTLGPDAFFALPYALIHGDVFADNVLVRDGAFVALIDFEQAIHGPCVVDLGMALVGLCRIPRGLAPARARALIGGYTSRRRLTDAEARALPQAAEYAALLVASWRHWKVTTDVPDAGRRDHPLAMVRVAEGIRRLSPAAWLAITRASAPSAPDG